MTIPAPNLSLASENTRSSHVEQATTGLSRSRAFRADTPGPQTITAMANTIWRRATGERGRHCIVIRRSGGAQTGGFSVGLHVDDSHEQAIVSNLDMRDPDGHGTEISCFRLAPIGWGGEGPPRQTHRGVAAPRGWFGTGGPCRGAVDRDRNLGTDIAP